MTQITRGAVVYSTQDVTWATLGAIVRDADGDPVTPASIELVLLDPDGTVVASPAIPPPDISTPGVYDEVDFTVPAGAYGRWTALWQTTFPHVTWTQHLDVFPPLSISEPSAQDVANIIPRRPLDPSGRALSTFSADTVPTDQQVEEIGRLVANEVLLGVGGVLPANILSDPARLAQVERLARYVAAVGAAAQVELNFFPENASSVAEPLQARFEALLERLRGIIVTPAGDLPPDGDGPGGESGTGFVGYPVYDFPAPLVVELGY